MTTIYRGCNIVPTFKARAHEAVDKMEHGDELVIKKPSRKSEVNALLHARLSDVAFQLRHHGEKLSINDWKDLLVPAWYKATGRNPRIRPNLDGDGFARMYRSTTTMTNADALELADFVDAYGTTNGVKWTGV